jgi:tetratricopeptide (TPR) repeat protein
LKKILLIFVFILFALNLFHAQNRAIDSLKVLLSKSISDTSKINIYSELGWEYCYSGIPDSSLFYANKILKVNDKNFENWLITKKATATRILGINKLFSGDNEQALSFFKQALKLAASVNSHNEIGKAKMSIGHAYLYQSKLDTAFFYYSESLTEFELINLLSGISDSYLSIGIVHTQKGNYIEAIHFFFKALSINEKNNFKEKIPECLNNIAAIYLKKEEYQKALVYFNKILLLSEETNNKFNIANAYSNIGHIYIKLKEYEKAIKYLNLATDIYKTLNFVNGISTSHQNIALAYECLLKYDLAVEFYELSIKEKKAENDFVGLPLSLTNLSSLYIYKGNYETARKYLLEAESISLKIGDFETIKNVYFNLTYLEDKTGNIKSAFKYHKLYVLYYDSLNKQENDKKFIQTTMQYEFDKKTAADSIKVAEEKKVIAAQLKQEKTQRFALYGGLILVGLFGVFMFNRFRVTQKQKHIIELKEKETLAQKHVIEEKHKEITDSINYAERIQRSLLASKEMLDKNLNLLSVRAIPITTGTRIETMSVSTSLDVTSDNYFIFFKPKDIVSGDFYWAAEIQDSKLKIENCEQETTNKKQQTTKFVLCTADSTGHGVPGAIMSILNIACLNEAVKEGYKLPNEILNRTRREIISVLKRDGSAEGGKDGMDCSLLVFDFNNLKLQIAAANNPVWIVREIKNDDMSVRAKSRSDDQFKAYNSTFSICEIKPDKMPVGKHDKQDVPFTLHEVALLKGDIVYTLTDGFPDQFGGEKGKKYMIKNLRELIVTNAHLPMHEQKQLLENTFNNWKGNSEQVDDVSVIGIRV